MELMAAALAAFCVSLIGNAVLTVICLRAARRHKAELLRVEADHKAELERAKKAPAPTVSAEQILHDLTAGGAIVRVERLNPADLFLRSPRQ